MWLINLTVPCFSSVDNWEYSAVCWPLMWKQMLTKWDHDFRELCGVSGVFIFMLRPHMQKNADKMPPWSLCMFIFTLQYIRIWQITLILIAGKTLIPIIGAPCWDKYGAGSGISGLCKVLLYPPFVKVLKGIGSKMNLMTLFKLCDLELIGMPFVFSLHGIVIAPSLMKISFYVRSKSGHNSGYPTRVLLIGWRRDTYLCPFWNEPAFPMLGYILLVHCRNRLIMEQGIFSGYKLDRGTSTPKSWDFVEHLSHINVEQLEYQKTKQNKN